MYSVTTFKHYDRIENIAKREGAMTVPLPVTLYTSYAVERLKKDFCIHSAELMKQEHSINCDDYDQRFTIAHTKLLSKIEVFMGQYKTQSPSTSNELNANHFEDVIGVCRNSCHMLNALKKLDQLLINPFNLKKQGLISKIEFDDTIQPIKDVWREFIATAVPKVSQI